MDIHTQIESMIKEWCSTDVFDLRVCPDPENSGVYAVRVSIGSSDCYATDLLVNMNCEEDPIEEVEWVTWPPQTTNSRNPFY